MSPLAMYSLTPGDNRIIFLCESFNLVRFMPVVGSLVPCMRFSRCRIPLYCRVLLALCFLLFGGFVMARDTLHVVRVHPPVTFPQLIPPGNYSGICHFSGDQYLVVDDKSPTDGFYSFTITFDSISGSIQKVSCNSFLHANRPHRDAEGIAWMPQWQTVLIAGEADNRILEYTKEGVPTGREIGLPEIYRSCGSNYGLESLTYSPVTHRLWTCSESTLPADGSQSTSLNGIANRLRLQSFNEQGLPLAQYAYQMDAPGQQRTSRIYAMGVSELLALDDGSLLVLEREFYVPSAKIGSFVRCKLYQVWPDEAATVGVEPLTDTTSFLSKHLVYEWTTKLNLTRRNLANYEGMCLGPLLADGSRVLLLVADSQSRYKGVMKDWFLSIVVR